MAQDRWLKRWSDENGERAAIIREKNKYYLRFTVPAWEPRAGEKTFTAKSIAEAQAYDFDAYDEGFEFSENEQAKMENDPFFEN